MIFCYGLCSYHSYRRGEYQVDRYEYNVRLEQIRSLAENQEFHEAMVIADSIDWRTVRSVRTLSFVSEIYKINRRSEEARDILLLADSRCPNARSIVYALCELSIRMGDLNDSVGYLKEYMDLAPQDPSTFILQYKFYDFTNVGIHQRIEVLEQLKGVDYQERWGYELAKLYAEAGEISKCVAECDALSLWFGHGRYVTEAMKLKMRYEDLTPEQQHKFDHRDAIEVLAGAEEVATAADIAQKDPLSIEITNIQPSNQPTKRIPGKEINGRLGLDEIKEPSINLDKYSTMNLQAELKRNMADLEEKTGEPLREREVALPPMRDPVKIKADSDLKEIRLSEEKQGAAVEEAADLEADDILSNRIPINIRRKEQPKPEYSSAFSEYISEEYDGQLSLNVPETGEDAEKQITGQLNLEDIMNGNTDPRPSLVNIGEPLKPEPLKPEPLKPGPLKPEPLKPEPIRPEPPKTVPTGPEFITPEPIKPASPKAEPEPIQPAEPAHTPVVMESGEEEIAEEAPRSRLMKRETMEITSDLTGLLREHREKASLRKARQKAEAEEPEEESQVQVMTSPGSDSEPEEIYDEPEEEPEDSGNRDDRITEYVPPRVQEIRGFDDEEKEIFAQFLPMHDLPGLIRGTLDAMKMNGRNGNVFLTGNEQSARVSLANALARGFAHEHPDEFVGKIATIPADLFNTKNVPDVLNALDGCALVIQHAADLSDASFEDIRKALTKPDASIMLMLEEAKPSYRSLVKNRRMDWLEEVFDVRIEIPTYTNDDLVSHGREYAREQEYIIDDMGVLALYTKIDERQTADHFVTIDEVEEIVDEAIRHVNRRTPGHFLDMLVGKRYDDDDMIIIRERDFT